MVIVGASFVSNESKPWDGPTSNYPIASSLRSQNWYQTYSGIQYSCSCHVYTKMYYSTPNCFIMKCITSRVSCQTTPQVLLASSQRSTDSFLSIGLQILLSMMCWMWWPPNTDTCTQACDITIWVHMILRHVETKHTLTMRRGFQLGKRVDI